MSDPYIDLVENRWLFESNKKRRLLGDLYKI